VAGQAGFYIYTVYIYIYIYVAVHALASMPSGGLLRHHEPQPLRCGVVIVVVVVVSVCVVFVPGMAAKHWVLL
jgi:hypothetical protein